MRMGHVPVLDVDGLKIPQSAVARKFGFAGKTPEDQAWVDALVDQFKDYYKDISDYYYTVLGYQKKGDPEEPFKSIFVPARDRYFGLLADLLKKNGTGYLVGDSVTWADLVWTDHMTILSKIHPRAFHGFPEVLALKERVESIPQIKKWIETRPQITPF